MHLFAAPVCKAILLGGVLLFFLGLTFSITHPSLPSQDTPILFYSNQTGDDIKRIFQKSIQKAKHTLFLQIYGFTDSDLIEEVQKSARRGLSLNVFYDPSGSHNLNHKIHEAIPIKCQGLMHKKILVLDHETVFIGTANLTPTSLCMHDNVVIGFYHKGLANFLENSIENELIFTIGNQKAQLWHLPDFQNQCLNSILNLIDTAKHSIQISLFTFTHPQIIKALIEAHQRGVLIEVALDFYTAKGASKKTLESLNAANIFPLISKRGKLLHHKWCLIDKSTLLLGSANWTKSAFTKNEDCLLLLYNLTKEQNTHFEKIWKDIKSNTTTSEIFKKKSF